MNSNQKVSNWTKRLIFWLSAKLNLNWDTPVPDKLVTLQKVWLDELFELPKFIKIPRQQGFGKNTKIELNVFVNAITKVFAATVY